MTPLRIGLLCHHGVGGSSKIAVELANGLASRGHDVHLFTRRPPLGLRTFARGVTLHCETGGAATSRLHTGWSEDEIHAFAAHVSRVSERLSLDLLHVHYALPFAEVGRRLAAGGARQPMIATLHGTDVTGPDTAGLAVALDAFDAITTVSQAHASLACARLELDAPPEVIPNFVDTNRFRPLPRRHRRPVIVHVSNFRRVKDPAMLARVYLRLRESVDAELWLVGDGEEMPAVRDTLAPVAGSVRMFGLRHDVASIVARGDVFALTSESESFGLVALEAAACGVPVVAPAVGGLPEVVDHGRTGLLFEPGDDRAATEALAVVLRDATLRASMGRAAVARAALLSADLIVPRYEALYRRVLAARNRSLTPMLAAEGS